MRPRTSWGSPGPISSAMRRTRPSSVWPRTAEAAPDRTGLQGTTPREGGDLHGCRTQKLHQVRLALPSGSGHRRGPRRRDAPDRPDEFRVQEIEKRAEQIVAAASAQGRAALVGLLKHDAAVDTLLADAQGSEVVHEPGQVTDQGDGEYSVKLTRVADGCELVLFLSHRDVEWGPVVTP